jgi:hypothetical protein
MKLKTLKRKVHEDLEKNIPIEGANDLHKAELDDSDGEI